MSPGHMLRTAAWTRPLWWIIAAPTAVALALYSHLVRLTSRVTLTGAGAAYDGPAVYVNWHRHLPFTIVVNGQARRWMMMLDAPYMAPIAWWCQLMGLRLVRGASGAGGREALARLIELMKQGESAVLAVDGPAGPAFRVRPGCVDLARSAQVPIIPVAYRARHEWTVRGRWDRMLLLWPFNQITVLFGEPIHEPDIDRVTQELRALDPEQGAG